jgi:formate hydrogenlyase transcriptional activator
VEESWFRRETRTQGGPSRAYDAVLDTNERQMIEGALSTSRGRVGGINGAAAKLGIPRQTLESKIKSLGINKFRFRQQ